MRIDIEHRTTGPREDPYSEVTYVVERNGHTYKLRVCSLSETHRYTVDGQEECLCTIPVRGRSMAEVKFLGATGFRSVHALERAHARAYVPDPMGDPSQYL